MEIVNETRGGTGTRIGTLKMYDDAQARRCGLQKPNNSSYKTKRINNL